MISSENFKNIIIRMPNWLGDAVMATPLIADLRNHFPSARITAMCQANVASLFEQDNHIDEILSFKKSNGWIHGESRDIICPLRYGNFDLGILTTNSFSSAWWFWRGHVQNKIGFATNLRSFLLDKAISFPKKKESQHQVVTYKALLTPFGIPISNSSPYLKISQNERGTAKIFLENQDTVIGKHEIIGINPGAAFGSAKCWLPERFKDLTLQLVKNPSVRLIYFGDRHTADLVKTICKDMPSSVINLAGKTTLRELLALIASCSVMLSNDSGPMHIAAALNVPLVALFGSTSALKTGPYLHGTVIHKHVACSPCYKRVCPIDFKCMKQIEVNEVYNAIISHLRGKH